MALWGRKENLRCFADAEVAQNLHITSGNGSLWQFQFHYLAAFEVINTSRTMQAVSLSNKLSNCHLSPAR
jgi:hypothetical protein